MHPHKKLERRDQEGRPGNFRDVIIGTRTLVSTMDGKQVPMAQIADIKLFSGPGMIRDENGSLSGYVYVDLASRDLGGYVADAKKAVAEKVLLPTGYTLAWSGQYEYLQRVEERLLVVVPITIFITFLLIYFNTGSTAKTLIIFLAVPFSAVERSGSYIFSNTTRALPYG